jgi:hypothetical protein
MSNENKLAIARPAPATAPVTQDLTANERGVLTQYYGTLVAAKARIFDLQVQLETAREALQTAESNLIGATTTITGAHGMSSSTINADFTQITAKV